MAGIIKYVNNNNNCKQVKSPKTFQTKPKNYMLSTRHDLKQNNRSKTNVDTKGKY